MKRLTSILLCALAFTVAAFTPGLRGQSAPTITTLHSFMGSGTDGDHPTAGLVQGSDGNFYGTTELGGSGGVGTFFQITPAGVLTTLHSFPDTGTDGGYPFAGLVQASDGNFYGTTEQGGSSNAGTVFRITPTGVLTTLHSCTGTGTDGDGPKAGLVQASDGNFYGTTEQGGSSNSGTVFRMTPAGVLTTLHSFPDTGTDGGYPVAGLVQASDGNFYGTTFLGGSSNTGTVFRITPTGVLTTLHSFTGTGTDGGYPVAGLVQASDGNFYGTTGGGNSDSDYGTVFRMTPAGVLTTLHSFTGTGTDGDGPEAGLVQGSDGNFYGTTDGGGSGGHGTVFRITPTGVLTTLHNFTGTGTDGGYSRAGLVQASDGNFYGTTFLGGSSDNGTVFRMTIAPPVITSATQVAATAGHPFSYQITASGGPTNFDASNLPAGLSIDGHTGLISGTPQQAGTYTITLGAANAFGKGSATLTLSVVAAGTPFITSPTTLAVPEDTEFSYQITATDSPTSFGAGHLPSGLTVDAKTGLISGQHHGRGTETVTLYASNAKGKGSAYLMFKVYGPPVITSATTAEAVDGQPFSYQITADNEPTTFGVQNLPPGLTVDAMTGLISGTHKGAGGVVLTLNAYNAVGKGSAALNLYVRTN